MDDRNPNFRKLRTIIEAQLGVSPEQVTEDASFINDLGADSLDCVELIMAVESEFDIDIPDEESEKLSTVGAVVQYLDENAE